MAYLKIFYDMEDTVTLMADAEAGRLLKAALAYGRRGEVPRMSGAERLLFPIIKNQIDRDTESYAAMCQRNKENRHKGLTSRDHSSPVVTSRDQDKDKDKDKEEDKDKDKDKDNDKDKPLVRDAVMAYAQSNLQFMSYGNLEELVAFKNDLPDDVIMYAIDTATGNGKRMWSYVRRILARWADEGIKSIGEVKAQEQRWQRNSVRGEDGKRMQNPALNYQHGGIDYEALDKLGQDFWKE